MPGSLPNGGDSFLIAVPFGNAAAPTYYCGVRPFLPLAIHDGPRGGPRGGPRVWV